MLAGVGAIVAILIGISECVSIAEPLGYAMCKAYGEHVKSQTMPEALKDPNKYPMPEKERCTRYKWNPGKCKMEGCKKFMNTTCGPKRKGARMLGDKSTRIIGGVGTTGKRYPYVVQIRWEPTERGRVRGKCSGTLIDKRWVITSAQCALLSLRRRNHQATHTPGLVTFADDVSLTSCQENSWEKAEPYYVISVEVPPLALIDIDNLIVGNPSWDMALLKLNKVVKKKIPVRLPVVGEHQNQPGKPTPDFCNSSLKQVGWGRTKKNTGRDEINPAKVVAKQGLFKSPFERYGAEHCTRVLSNLYEFDPEQQMCGYTTLEDTEGCSSDCGGPVVYQDVVYDNQNPTPTDIHVLCGVITRPACEKGELSNRATIAKAINNKEALQWIKKIIDAF